MTCAGCTDPTACNYDETATVDDGLCDWNSCSVTFNVDMTCAPSNFENVFVSGPWCGWCANDTYNVMTDPEGDGIYSVTIVGFSGLVEYKYAINAFEDQEHLINDVLDGATCAIPIPDFPEFAYRTIESGSTANDYYGTCDGVYNDPTSTVTFSVDMGGYSGTYETVNLNGSFNGWCGSCAAAEMLDADGDGVYTLDVDMDGYVGTVEYKFTVDGWNDFEEFPVGASCTSTNDGFTNRTLELAGESVVLPVVCWNQCLSCESIAMCPADHVVEVSSYMYAPSTLTIAQGESVAFVNLGGTHDVNGDVDSQTGMSFGNPESFYLGAISGSPEGECIGTYTFNVPGTYNYDCSIGNHAAQGMVASIVVTPAPTPTTVVDVIVNSPDHEWLEAAIDAAGLADALSAEGPFTVFAPTDHAVNALADALEVTADDLLTLENLGDLLQYHVVAGEAMSTELSDGQIIATLLGPDVTVAINEEGVFINDAQVTVADIVAENGVVHAIEALLIPPPPTGGVVVFQVDMNDYSGSYNQVNLNGSFNGWCGGCSVMTDDDGDNVYQLEVDLAPGTYEYKFTLDGWSQQEVFEDGDACTSTMNGFVNRTIDVTESVTLGAVCWGQCTACNNESVPGCTDPGACNFSAVATVDDGSCDFPDVNGNGVPDCEEPGAGMLGFVVEVDTVFYGVDTPTPDDTFDPEGILEGYASFIVYAAFGDSSDFLSAVFADNTPPYETVPMAIDAPCGCHNPLDGSLALDGTNHSVIWSIIP